MQSIARLRREHAAIRTAVTLLDVFAKRMRNGDEVALRDIEVVLDGLVELGERCHCAREERFLYPLLEQRGTSRDARCIAVLLIEHGAAREVLRTLTHLASSLEADPDSRRAFAQTVESAVPMLRNHVDKEERTLYKLAETVLTAEDDATLARQFASHDRDVTNEASQAQLFDALAELATRHGITPQP